METGSAGEIDVYRRRESAWRAMLYPRAAVETSATGTAAVHRKGRVSGRPRAIALMECSRIAVRYSRARMGHDLLAALLGIACAGCVAAAEAQVQDARALAAGCASCHQPGDRIPPPLAGQSRDTLVAKLRAFRDGTKRGTVMPQLAKGYTPAQLDAVAGYFATQGRAR